jgi:hydrogenase maturation factor
VCLGECGVVVAVPDPGHALVRLGAGDRRVSLAVLVADGIVVAPGDVVMVAMGLALRVVDGDDPAVAWAGRTEVV